jgi:surface carbohydrate biosynthesis protein
MTSHTAPPGQTSISRFLNREEIFKAFDAAFADVVTENRPVPEYRDYKRPPRKVSPWLYLPVEVKARELKSKALIARQAKAAGLNVFMGASWNFNESIPHLPPGVVLLKSANAVDGNNIVRWMKAGHLTAVLDEEMFGVVPTPEFMSATIHPYIPMAADLICAQGQAYVDAFPYPVTPVVTGNPRVLTYDTTHGDDILVCLMSGNINNAGPSLPEMLRAVLKLAPSPLTTDKGRAWANVFRNSMAHEFDLLPLVIGTIQALSEAFPTRRIVVRPHPVERAALWAFPQSNVVVESGGSIMDAMRKSAVLLYVSGCTTGVDAYFSRMPAVRLGSGGPGSISETMHVEARTPEEAVEAVRRGKIWDADLTKYFAPVTLVDHLIDLYRRNRAETALNLTELKQIQPTDMHKRKFPDTTVEEVSALVGYKANPAGWNSWVF